MPVRAVHAVVREARLREDEGALADDLRLVAVAVGEHGVEHLAVADDGAQGVGLQTAV